MNAADKPGVHLPPPLVFLAAFVTGWLLPRGTPNTAARIAGAVLLVVGLALMGGFLRELRRARTSIAFGKATALVTTGPYQVSRNPGYSGMACATAGLAFLTGTWWALATLAVAILVVDRVVVVKEERHLRAVFGAEYDAYRARTRRWL